MQEEIWAGSLFQFQPLMANDETGCIEDIKAKEADVVLGIHWLATLNTFKPIERRCFWCLPSRVRNTNRKRCH